MDNTTAFEKMLARGVDNALLRYSLGMAALKHERAVVAIEHLARAVEFDAGYSAAWKAYGKALAMDGRDVDAMDAYRAGIEAAQNNGDVQAAKEMGVFLRRLEKVARGRSAAPESG